MLRLVVEILCEVGRKRKGGGGGGGGGEGREGRGTYKLRAARINLQHVLQ